VVFQASGLVGEDNTWGGEGVVSGVYNKLSMSAAYTHAETDGFRNNSDFEDDLVNVFAQVSLSPDSSVQGEYRYRNEDAGDITRRFDPEDYSDSLRNDENATSYRLGFRHAFRPHSDLIVSFIYQDADYEQNRVVPTPPGVTILSDFETSIHGYTAEAQHQFRRERFSLISGAGYFDADRKDTDTDTTTVSLPFPPFVITKTVPEVTRSDIRHTNLYLYSQVTLPESVTWTLGASGDFFDGGLLDLDRDQFNPKLGLIWNVVPDTTLRAAVFRTFKRTLISNQTIEPTQVAGFNQFFDDVEGTEAWHYGVAVDQKFSRSLFGGAEFSMRDLDVPIYQADIDETKEADWDEEVVRAYLFWAPHEWVSLSAEYRYESFKRDKDAVGVEQFSELETHRFPLGINFFHPSGFSVKFSASYVDQSGDFVDPTSKIETTDSDRFWVVDASVSYRLPRRVGIFSVEAKNLFDESFRYLDMDPAKPALYPERLVLARLTLNF
jgi:outer membrane receptor protein involved in Fe transport